MPTRNTSSEGELCRVQFVGGPLSGATLDLPVELAEAPPGRLVITADGIVFDRYRSRPVPEARIVEAPTRSGPQPERRPSRRPSPGAPRSSDPLTVSGVRLAAADFSGESEHARTAMLALRGGRWTQKLHWNEMDDRKQHVAAAVRGPGRGYTWPRSVLLRRQRSRSGRRAGLRRLAYKLHGVGVTQIIMESRQLVLDRQDVGLIAATRSDLPKGTRLRVDHRRGAAEPQFRAARAI